jgi:hypothetical protein
MYPDDRVLVAILNSQRDWALVQDEGWYRLPAKHAQQKPPPHVGHVPIQTQSGPGDNLIPAADFAHCTDCIRRSMQACVCAIGEICGRVWVYCPHAGEHL